MKINSEFVSELRAQRDWSQEELATVSGLNIRTIQRIENEATISLQSKKALASAFDIDIRELDYDEEVTTKKYEYKTLVLKFDIGWSKKASQGPFEFDRVLNEQGEQGWRVSNLIQGTAVHGGSGQAIVTFEREVI